VFIAPASAATPRGEPVSTEAVQKWIYGYRAHPDAAHLPGAVRALSRFGALKDPETSGIYVGFIAGVIGTNPSKAEALVAKMLPLRGGDDWVIVRAIAYSGLPDWKHLLEKFADQMPTRRVMIEKHLAGDLPTLDDIRVEEDPGMFSKMRDY